MTEKSVLGIAIVGCGQIVTHHLDAIAQNGLADVYRIRALCDPSAQRRSILAGLPAVSAMMMDVNQPPISFDSLTEMSQNESVLAAVDIIFIAVPHDLHESLTVQAMQLNKIVVLEKPLAPTSAQCRRLVQLSQDSKTSSMLIVAEQSPHWPAVVEANRQIQTGAIGTVVTAASYYYESMRDNVTSGDVTSSGGLGWRGSLARAGGGIALDGGLHWIRPLREMCGKIEQVVGVIRTHLAPSLQMEGESVGHALLQIQAASTGPLAQPKGAGPLMATYSCNMLATAPMAHDTCPYFRITGDQGELVIAGNGLFKETLGAGGLRLYNKDHPSGVELLPTDRKGGFFLGFAGLWKEIHRICTTNDRAAAHETVVRASDDVHTVLALYTSSKSRQWESTSF